MKPSPAPHVPGDTLWERLDSAIRKVFTVPKEALLKEEARRKRNHTRSSYPQHEMQSGSRFTVGRSSG